MRIFPVPFLTPNVCTLEGRPPWHVLNIDLIDQKKIIEGPTSICLRKEGLYPLVRHQNKTNDTQLIFEVLDYFEFVGLTLSKRYVAEGKKERSRFDKLEKLALILEPNVAAPPSSPTLIAIWMKPSRPQQMVLISRPLPPQKTSAPITKYSQ